MLFPERVIYMKLLKCLKLLGEMRLNSLDRILLLRLIYMQDCFVHNQASKCILQKPHLEIYRNTFVCSGSSVWNSLPSYIHNSNSVHHVKAQYLRWVNPNDQGHL